MAAEKRKPLPPGLASRWSQLAHAFYLQALITESNWGFNEIAFHGGTSLRMSWNSPRHSEDLDFLLARQVENLDAISAKVEQALKDLFLAEDPNLRVELRSKTKDPNRMAVYQIVVSHPYFIGNAMAKAEFWRVDDSYLAGYPVALRTPATQGEVVGLLSTPIPAATLQTAYADKLTAFATRPHLKWRDIYDLWWIGTQTNTPLKMPEVAAQFLHNLGGYTTREGLPPAQALRLFLANDRDGVIQRADPDLKRWLPESVWDALQRQGAVDQMVDYVFHALGAVADHLDPPDDSHGHDEPDLNRPRG